MLAFLKKYRKIRSIFEGWMKTLHIKNGANFYPIFFLVKTQHNEQILYLSLNVNVHVINVIKNYYIW